MAKKDTSTALVETREVSESLAVAGDVKSNRGREAITQQDMTLPRLAIAQRTSPQIEEGKPEFIEGLRMFDLFNSLTGDRYGKGPVKVALVRFTKRAMQFDADNNVVDPNVPLDDPRCQFHGDEKPEATVFHEYLAVLADTFEPVVLSLKGTQVKTAKKLNGLITVRGGDLWGGLYDVASTSKQVGAFTVGTYVITPAGKTPENLAQFCEELYVNTQGKTIQTDRDARPEGDAADSGDAPF